MTEILTRARRCNHYVLITLDSCRYDSFVRANPRHIPKLGPVERRWSYASWTSPSHYNLLIGLMPHVSPKNVYASEYYKQDFLRFNARFGTNDFEFRSLIPHLFLPLFLRNTLGYRTHAMVSLPVLNPKTPLNVGFETFTLMEKHNDMRGMLARLNFDDDRPSFYLLNVGETHYPYALPGEPSDEWPRIHGVHGVFKHLDEHIVGGQLADDRPFDHKKLDELRDRQVAAVKYVDGVVEELFDLLPQNTYVTITADHGELFGEEGYFGHGPIQHEKVFEVPFVEGLVR
jgi:hypothetical protein